MPRRARITSFFPVHAAPARHISRQRRVDFAADFIAAIAPLRHFR